MHNKKTKDKHMSFVQSVQYFMRITSIASMLRKYDVIKKRESNMALADYGV